VEYYKILNELYLNQQKNKNFKLTWSNFFSIIYTFNLKERERPLFIQKILFSVNTNYKDSKGLSYLIIFLMEL